MKKLIWFPVLGAFYFKRIKQEERIKFEEYVTWAQYQAFSFFIILLIIFKYI